MSPKSISFSLLGLAGIAAVGLSAACAPVGFQNPAAREQALSVFKDGRATMNCGVGIGCMLNWTNVRPAVQNLAQADRWQDVADVILANGYNVNLRVLP